MTFNSPFPVIVVPLVMPLEKALRRRQRRIVVE
jgi:hypothetical protein